jgi:hypothetical protein
MAVVPDVAVRSEQPEGLGTFEISQGCLELLSDGGKRLEG